VNPLQNAMFDRTNTRYPQVIPGPCSCLARCASRLTSACLTLTCSRHRLSRGSGANTGTSPQESDDQSILLGRSDHHVRKSVPGLCPQGQSNFQGVLPDWHRKDVQCSKEASYKRSAKLDRAFGNSDGESQVPMANVNIAGWLSAALTSLWAAIPRMDWHRLGRAVPPCPRR
jgi:hypothetical protein